MADKGTKRDERLLRQPRDVEERDSLRLERIGAEICGHVHQARTMQRQLHGSAA